MKLWKHSILSALAFFGICTAVVFTACDRDSCLTLKCKNNATCVNGFCQCPTGYEGAECQILATDRFIGTYVGNTTCNNMLPKFDTAKVDVRSNPNIITVFINSRSGAVYHGTIEGNSVQLRDSTEQISGHLLLDKQKITFTYKEAANSETENCTFVGNRP